MALCWLVNNLSYYHEARLAAFAAKADVKPWIVEWTDRDELVTLENRADREYAFHRLTIHPSVPLKDIEIADARRKLTKVLDRLKPSVVCINGWGMFGSRSVLAWCIRRGVPAVLMSESTAEDRQRSWWVEAAKRRIVRLFSTALVGGTPHREYLEQLGFPASRIFTGYDVVDNDHFCKGAASARETTGLRVRLGFMERYFVACSRFGEKKNLFRLLDAYAAYRAACQGTPWKLVILGDGELRSRLEQHRSQLGLAADVVMPGAKGYEELPVYYALAGAFVHASTSEQWGLVTNEAMACGLPVIVSNRCGCARDLVSERNGFTFDPFDTKELAGLMAKISSGDCDLERMGRSSIEIISRWGPQAFAQNLLMASQAAIQGPRSKVRFYDYLPLWEH